MPLYQCLLISVSTGAGGLLFGEFADVPFWQLMGYSAGVAAAAFGLAALSLADSSDDADDDNEFEQCCPKTAAPSADPPGSCLSSSVDCGELDGQLPDQLAELPLPVATTRRASTRGSMRERGASLVLPMGFSFGHIYLEHLQHKSHVRAERSRSLPSIEMEPPVHEFQRKARRARSASSLA